MMKLSDVCQVDLAELTKANTPITVINCKFERSRSVVGCWCRRTTLAVDLAPNLVEGLANLFSNYQTLAQRLGSMSDNVGAQPSDQASEQRVHEFIHSRGNYFGDLEDAALHCALLNSTIYFALSI